MHELDVLVPEGVPAALVLLREVALLAGHLQAVLGGVQALGLYRGVKKGVSKKGVSNKKGASKKYMSKKGMSKRVGLKVCGEQRRCV